MIYSRLSGEVILVLILRRCEAVGAPGFTTALSSPVLEEGSRPLTFQEHWSLSGLVIEVP